jgi:methionyl-tRNA formyltransferase
LKIAFAGTPTFAATILRGLIDSEHEVGLVISQPDRRRGRGRKLIRTPVAALALEANLPLHQPARIGEIAGEISAHDALVVAAYGQILRPDTLYAARLGAWNVHASLLPAYRGAAPIERAIMNGETETGVSIMRMDEGLDTGPVALQRRIPIPPDMTGGVLTQALANLGSNAIVEALTKLETESITLSEQNSLYATYAAKLEDEERVIRWAEEVEKVHDLVRALAPHIGARTLHPEFSGPIKVLRSKVFKEPQNSRPDMIPGEILPANARILVACRRGVLEVLELQAPGGRALSAADFLRGRRLEGAFYT